MIKSGGKKNFYSAKKKKKKNPEISFSSTESQVRIFVFNESKCASTIHCVSWRLLKSFPHRIGSEHGEFLHYLENKTKNVSTESETN